MPGLPATNSTVSSVRILDAAAKAAEKLPGKEEEPASYFALKYVFNPSKGDMGGAFCLIFEGTTGEIVLKVLWLVRSYVQRTFKPNRSWKTFVKMFPQLGPYDRMWSEKLADLLPELIPAEDRIRLFEEGDSTVKRRLLRVEAQIRRGFERTTQAIFDVSSDVELLTRSELEKAKVLKPIAPPPGEEDEAAKKKEEEEQAEKEKSFEGTVIQCLARVDPVRGKSVKELVPGDIIEVGIEGDTGAASALVQKFLEDTHQAPTFPVEEIVQRENKTYVYLRISDEIRGVLTLTKDLRLKTKRPVNIEKERHFMALEDLLFFGVLGIALIGLLLAVRYFFL